MTEFVNYETNVPDAPFEKKKYRVAYKCRDCGHEWKGPWRSSVPKKDPDCPNTHCAEMRALRQTALENQRLRQMLEERKAPGHIGDNNQVKAVDATAEIVMQDYGMTDLKSGVREGEGVAPKLPPAAQAAADNYFGGAPKDQKAVDFGTGRMRTIQAKQLDVIAKRAIAGSYRRMSVAPNSVIPEKLRSQSPLQVVRTQNNEQYRGSR